MFIKLVFLQVTKFGKLSITVINSTFKFLLFNLAFVCNLEIKMKKKQDQKSLDAVEGKTHMT